MKNMFNAIFALVAAALLLIPAAALAQASAEDRQIAGTTPDSFFYGFDTFFDGVSLFFTFDDRAKADKWLEIARERLFEAKVMIEDNKLQAADVARMEHENALREAGDAVERLQRANATEEIRDVLEIRKGLDEQENEIEDVKQNIRARVEGQLNEEQKALVNSILNSLSSQTERVKIDIRNKEDRIKIKIRQETGRSEIEIEREIEDLKGAIGIEDIGVKAEIVGNAAQIKIENDFSTGTAERSALVGEIITRFALDREKADRLLRIQVGDDDSERERLEIKAETRAGVTEVEAELRFNLGSADRNAMLDAIVQKTKLTREQVDAALQIGGEGKAGEQETKVRAEVFANVSEARVELKFDTAAAEKNAIAQEVLNKAKMSKVQVENLLKIETVADNFEARLSGANEVPPAAMAASGRADLDLRRNDTELQFRVTVNNIGNATFSHIHLAAAGQNGPVAAFLFAGSAKTGAFTGVLAEGIVTSANLTGPLAGQPFSALVEKIRVGEAYVNVHTLQNPAGEIRGQIVPEQAAQIRERLEAEAKTEKGATEIKFEFRFPTSATEKAGIAEAIFQKLSALTVSDILNVLKLEVKDEGNNGRDGGQVCIQVITPAVSPKGECRDFPTPCDVPENWEKVGSCPASGKAVVITSAGFKPDRIEISAGEAVTWINRDTTVRWPASGPHPQHTAYPETGGCIGSKFDACKGLAQGETFSFAFNQKGEWQYHDHLHFGAPFFGTVVVK